MPIVRDVRDLARFLPERMEKIDVFRGPAMSAGLNTFEPGQEHAAHAHAGQDKLYVVIEGRGEILVDGVWHEAEPGTVALAPAGSEHAVRNPGERRLTVLVVMAPPPAPKT